MGEIDLSQFVDQYYRMDPETEDLFYGSELMDGMRVLTASFRDRADLRYADKGKGDAELALKRNRWCTVSKYRTDDTEVSFIGIYDDGTKIIHTHSVTHGWLVKLDSIPDNYLEDQEIKNALEVLRQRFSNESEVDWIAEAELWYDNQKEMLTVITPDPIPEDGIRALKKNVDAWVESRRPYDTRVANPVPQNFDSLTQNSSVVLNIEERHPRGNPPPWHVPGSLRMSHLNHRR